jgi:hypothetical protein
MTYSVSANKIFRRISGPKRHGSGENYITRSSLHPTLLR